jgi:hypothetical protein
MQRYVTLVCIILPLLGIFILITILYEHGNQKVFASSPSLTRQQITDNVRDVIDSRRENITRDDRIDILSVNYVSDGRTLNTTMWLFTPLYKKSPPANISYGMLIDADFNNNTGTQGADYRVSIDWNNKSKRWQKTIQEYETPFPQIGISEKRIIDIKNNYTGFFEDKKRYVTIPTDLSLINFPDQYRVVFFATNSKGASLNADFTNWVNIPPPKLRMSLSENPVYLSAGSTTTVELQLNSTTGFEPNVYLHTNNQSNGIQLDFEPNKFVIPSYGMATSRLNIEIPNYIEEGQQITFPIFASISAPARSFVEVNSPLANTHGTSTTADNFRIPPSVSNQEILQQSTLTIRVLTFEERLEKFFTGLFTPITSIIATSITIISGFAGYLLAVRKYRNKGS